MVEFMWTKWIKTSLILILMLHFRAIPAQDSRLTVRDGDGVTLPCENRIKNQDLCESTTWLFGRSEGSAVVELVNLGQINKDGYSKSDRLSVTENCSLVIKKVTVDDVGQYTCRQFEESGRQGPSAQVQLSIINIYEAKGDVEMTLTCSVLTYDRCQHTVEWLYEGEKDDMADVKRSHRPCSAAVTFRTSPPDLKSKYDEAFKCSVTDDYSMSLQLCDLSPQSPCKKRAAPNGNTTSSARDSNPANQQVFSDVPPWWLYVAVAVGVAAVLIIVIGVIVGKRSSRKRTQMKDKASPSLNPAETESAPGPSQDMTDPEDGVSYASVSYVKKTNSKAQVQGADDDNHDDKGDTVTYSTVKASSSSAADGASADLSDLYATVNKSNK